MNWSSNLSKRAIAIAVVVAATFLAGCDSRERTTAAPSPPPSLRAGHIYHYHSTGPLASQWSPVGSQVVCFPFIGADGTLTESGLILRNTSAQPIEIVDYSIGDGSSDVSIIGKELLPLSGRDVMGDHVGFPPALSPNDAARFGLAAVVPAKGYILTPHSKGGRDVALFVGLRIANRSKAKLSFIDVTYRTGGATFHAYTPESIKVRENERECNAAE